MLKITKAILHTLILLTTIFTALPLRSSHAQVAPGSPAPSFTLNNALNAPVSLSQFVGKTVVLEWFNHTCPFVKKFYTPNEMQRLQRRAADEFAAVWLTISSSAPSRPGYLTLSEAPKIAEEFGIEPARLLLDPSGATGRAYGAKTTPHLFVINGAGRLVYSGSVDDIPTTKIEDVARGRNYVVEALTAIKAGKQVVVEASAPYGCSVKY
jgi:peroxiredoxin